jgi:hypothetical protein
VLFKAIPEAKGAVLQNPPNDSNQLILVGHLRGRLLPFNEVQGIIDEESEKIPELRDETLDARRSQNRQRTCILNLGPHHQQARDPEAMVTVEMADSQNPERFDAQPCLLEVDLAPFPSVKKIDLTLEPHRQRCEKPGWHRHHSPGTEKHTLHEPDPPGLLLSNKS